MEELSLHILDIVENSIAAGAETVEIYISEDTTKNLLTIEIKDNGRGMEEAMLAKVLDPFFTTKKVRRIGLGLPLLKQAAETACGELKIESKLGQGSIVQATFQLNHIDRQPLGDIAQTLRLLVITHPEIRFIYQHSYDEEKIYFDSQIKNLE
jgi:signal transduction histidine kinase